jgi:glycosyltransferase involved in cell wall biosynthesis
MRVLHITPYYENAWAYGGIPRVVSALAKGLVSRGHHVTVCTTDACDRASRLSPCARPLLRPWPPFRTQAGVEVMVFPNLSNKLAYDLQFFVPTGLGEFLRGHAGSFDVAHLHGCYNLPGTMAAYHLRRAAVPYLLSPHGTAPLIERHRLAKYIFNRTLGRSLTAGASRVLAVSEAERRQFLTMGLNPASIRVIGNPIDLAEFDDLPARGTFRARVGLGAEQVVLFLGKLTPRKRVDVLLRAFAALGRPNTHLVVAGNDMGHGRTLRDLAREIDLGSRVRFTGLLKGRERLEALADADVVAYPSQHEVFGLVPVEALLCGTPVIVADDSGCGEVIDRTGAGRVVKPGDEGALAQAIRELLDAPEAWRAAAAAAQEPLRRLFGLDAVCEQMEALYHEVASSDARVPGPSR